MKTVPPSEHSTADFELASVLMATEDLIGLCKKIESICGSVCVEKKREDGSRIVFEGAEEISNHATSITVPFTITTNGPEVRFTRFRVEVSYRKVNEADARTIYSILKQYSPWSFNYPGRTAAGLIFLAYVFGAIVKGLGDVTPIKGRPDLLASDIVFYMISSIAVGLYLFTFPGLGFIVRVSHTRKDTFLHRNKDKIIIAAVAMIFGGAITYVASPLLEDFLHARP